jgi:diguanylate cyclase (GGDEF)-like protein
MDILATKRDSTEQLRSILQRLRHAIDADLVLLGDVVASPFMRIQTLCCQVDRTWEPNFSYVLATHPCQHVITAQQFQQWQDVGDQFPEAYVLHDHGMKAYAGMPLSLGNDTTHGILVAMSKRPWKNPDIVQTRLQEVAAEIELHHETVLNAIERARLRKEMEVREEFFREYVMDNPTGVSLAECMPPIPLDLPEEELMHRLSYAIYVIECNQAMARMYGYADVPSILGVRPVDMNGPEKCRRVAEYWSRQNYDARDFESQTVDAQGNVTWVSGSVIGKIVDGKLIHCWTKRRDLTEQKRYEAAIHHKAHHDALTGLPNRYWFQEQVEALTKDHAARDKRLCVGLLDLNGFKEINDTLGHIVGDQILQAVAVRLFKGLKAYDAQMARLGGDEFAIIIPEISGPANAEAMAHAVQDLLSEPFIVEDMVLSIGGSIGLALFPDWQETGEDLLRLADVAMYAAKHEGMPFCWYRPEIDKHSKRRLSLLTSLGAGIGRGELFLVYQPTIDLASGEHAGFEALVRWKHPVHGLIPPNDFIPFAETNEVIRPLTQWVLDTAIEQGARWLAAGKRRRMAINVSVRNLLDETLESYIVDCLRKHQFPADLLELEVTESALMTRPAQAMSVLQALRAHGISIAIDDFGTGYSSLAYLARLPVTTLKVDQAFVKDMVRSKSEEQIVRSIIGLAHQCELTVVAEGVEDEETLAALVTMGCDVAQGYYIARPMETAQADQWTAHRKSDPKS